MATRRLKPDRHGPTYNRLVHLGQASQNTRQTLEQIRRQVETNDWEVPSSRE